MSMPEQPSTISTNAGIGRKAIGVGVSLALMTGLGAIEAASAAPGETGVSPRCDGTEVVLDASFFNNPSTYGSIVLDDVGVVFVELSQGALVATNLPSGHTAETSFATGQSSVAGGQARFDISALGGDFSDSAFVSYGALDCSQNTTTTTEPTTTTTEATTTTQPTTTTTEATTTTTGVTTTTEATTTTTEPGSTTTTEQGSTTTTAAQTTSTTRPSTTTSTQAPATQATAGGAVPVRGSANFTG